MAQTDRQLKAIMFSDVKSFSAMMSKDEERTVRLIKEHREIVRAVLGRYDGEEHGTAGDSFFVLFASAVNAVRCAVEIQESFHARNAAKPEDERIWIRIGIHLGDIIVDKSDGHVYGDGINIAARTEPQAEPGAICITKDVHEQVKRKLDLRYVELGRREMKNISDAPELYMILVGDRTAPPPSPADRPPSPAATGTKPAPPQSARRKKIAIGLVAVLILAGVAVIAYVRHDGRREPQAPAVIVWPKHPRLAALPFSSAPEREADKRLWPLFDRMIANRLAEADLRQGLVARIDPLEVAAEMKRREMTGVPNETEALEIALALRAEVFVRGRVVREAGRVVARATMARTDGSGALSITGQGADVSEAAGDLTKRIATAIGNASRSGKSKGLGDRPADPALEPALGTPILPEEALAAAVVPDDASKSSLRSAWLQIVSDPWSGPYDAFASAAAKSPDEALRGFAGAIAKAQSSDLPCGDAAKTLETRYPATMGPLAAAACLFRQEKAADAVSAATRAYADVVLRPVAGSFLRAVLSQVKNRKAQIAFQEERNSLFPEDAESWAFLAFLYAKDDDTLHAEATMKVAAALFDESNPSFGVALNGVRIALRSVRVSEATLWMEKLDRAAPANESQDMFRCTYKAEILMLQGRFTDGWRVLEEGLARFAEKPADAYTIVACMLYSSYLYFGRVDDAARIANQYLTFFPDRRRMDYWFGRVLVLGAAAAKSRRPPFELDRELPALTAEFAKLFPDPRVMDGIVCIVVSIVGSPEQARQIVMKADPANGWIPGCRFRAGELLAASSRHADALSHFERARADILYRGNWQIEFYLPVALAEARSAEALGDKVKAKRLYQAIVEQYAGADRDLAEVSAAREALVRIGG